MNIVSLKSMKITKKNDIEPKFKCGTRKAMNELSKELNLPLEEWMQDWPYEVVQAEDIEKYLKFYNTTEDEDKKFILMEMLIQSVEEQSNNKKFLNYWNIIEKIIEKDFKIHEYTVWYWCCFEEDSINNEIECDFWRITQNLRELWNKLIMT